MVDLFAFSLVTDSTIRFWPSAQGQIITELEELNKKADVIIGIMLTPEKKYVTIMQIIVNAIGIIGILSIVEIIKNWIVGG